MNIRRQNKSNLAGRIRKLLVKEVMFLYMGGVSGYMTGTNPTQGKTGYILPGENSPFRVCFKHHLLGAGHPFSPSPHLPGTVPQARWYN